MLYLYLGYLLVQFYPLIDKLSQSDLPSSALFFSISVFVIWSFIPLFGYLAAKLFNAHGRLNNYILIALGLVVGLLEEGLYYFNFLTYKQTNIGTLIAFFLFFIIAYISIKKTTNKLSGA